MCPVRNGGGERLKTKAKSDGGNSPPFVLHELRMYWARGLLGF